MINNIMLKDYVIIVIINLEEIKNHGNVIMINFMQLECVKIVILIIIIKRKGKLKIVVIKFNNLNLRFKKV
jgi:hypothetical protein